jgi:hypothetical protein
MTHDEGSGAGMGGGSTCSAWVVPVAVWVVALDVLASFVGLRAWGCLVAFAGAGGFVCTRMLGVVCLKEGSQLSSSFVDVLVKKSLIRENEYHGGFGGLAGWPCLATTLLGVSVVVSAEVVVDWSPGTTTVDVVAVWSDPCEPAMTLPEERGANARQNSGTSKAQRGTRGKKWVPKVGSFHRARRRGTIEGWFLPGPRARRTGP